MQPTALDTHGVHTRHAHRRKRSQPTADRQRHRIQRRQRARARRNVVQAQLHAGEGHRDAGAEEDADRAERPEGGAEVRAQQLVRYRVAGHLDWPGDAAAPQDGAGACLALQVGEGEDHPDCLAGAGEG